MQQRRVIKLIGLILFAFVFYLVIYKQDKLDINDIDKSKIESFDLILSKGQSVQSKFISLLKFTMNDYSHIGILVKEKDELFVLHSTPDGTKKNGIRFDDLQTFIDLSGVNACKILRHQDISDNHRLALNKEVEVYKSIQRPFDFDFDNLKNDEIYCSELVWLIFNKAELLEYSDVDLTKPIYPKYFQDIKGFIPVNFMKAERKTEDNARALSSRRRSEV